MKRIVIISLLFLSLVIDAAAGGNKQLLILHTNDTHSCIMPLKATLADTVKAGRGGYLRRLEMVKSEREKNPDLLLFDSGDFSQGSPYYTMFKGDVEVELMNMMHYDAATIGNHEFDFGLENMAR
ncbi:MAG TPA: metallophosphatase, partial [Prevotella sp.]|nr:metallophosphatase [Prevotella sp.]